jgi:signal transduction histidine kinase
MWIEFSACPLFDKNEVFKSAVGITRDITERKLAELQIKLQKERLQELNATKDKFFSIIAHDLKSPFNSIMGFCELLVEQIRKKDFNGIEKYAGFIRQSSQMAFDLLINLMVWSRSQTGRMECNPVQFDLMESILEITAMFDDIAWQKGIVIKRELPPKVAVFADRSMINTVLRNLISNAIKFTNPGGEIILTVIEEKNKLTVSVKDNGIGIPNNSIDKLFRIDENYSTRGTASETGTGLGLILCKEFIEKHNGEIRVESEPGKGSTFYFTLHYNAN